MEHTPFHRLALWWQPFVRIPALIFGPNRSRVCVWWVFSATFLVVVAVHSVVFHPQSFAGCIRCLSGPVVQGVRAERPHGRRWPPAARSRPSHGYCIWLCPWRASCASPVISCPRVVLSGCCCSLSLFDLYCSLIPTLSAGTIRAQGKD